MIAKWRTRIGVVVLAALMSLPLAARAYSTLYVLGDSLSDTGNLYAKTGSLPQAPYFDGRFSNGPVYAESLWSRLGYSGSLQPSYLGGTDYAVGGARSRYHSFDNGIPGFNPIGGVAPFYKYSLLGQRDALLASHVGGLDPNALYTVWEGSNDVSDAIGLAFSGQNTLAEALIAQSVADFTQVILDLVGAGAQHLLIPNIPNLGLVPEVVALGGGAQSIASGLTLAYNLMVANNLAAVSADIRRLDTYGILTALVDDPTAYGLPRGSNVDTACFTGFVGAAGDVCSDPERYVFWDKIHPSAAVHEVLGELAARAVPEPASALLAALALAALVLVRRRVTHPQRRIVLAA